MMEFQSLLSYKMSRGLRNRLEYCMYLYSACSVLHPLSSLSGTHMRRQIMMEMTHMRRQIMIEMTYLLDWTGDPPNRTLERKTLLVRGEKNKTS